MRDKWNFAKSLLLLLMIGFFVAEAVTFWYGMIYSGCGLARLKMVSAEEFASVRTRIFGIDDQLEKVRKELLPLASNSDNDFQNALAVKEWIVKQITATTGDLDRSKRTPYDILLAMREGKTGASCGYRALLYLGALKSIGIESRMTSLYAYKSAWDERATHATVEILIDGEWVVVDPYFNVYFLVSGKPASAVKLHQLLLGKANRNNLEIVVGKESSGSVAFGSADELLDYYYNVSIYERRHFFAWQALPPLQYFFGVAVAQLDDGSDTIQRTVRTRELIVLAYNFIFPIGFGVSAIAFIVLFIRQRRISVKRIRHE